MRYATFAVAATAVFLLFAAACGNGTDVSTDATEVPGIRVASFGFAESELLAEMYAQVIEATGVPVVRLGPVGPREIIAPALEQGRIDLVPEYLGTALGYWGAADHHPDTESARTELAELLDPRGLTVLAASPAQDKNVFVVTAELAEEENLETISDLAAIAGDARFGGPAECRDRQLCFAGLESVYVLTFAEFVVQPSLSGTAEALRNREIDVGLMFSTASELEISGLVVLDDDRGLQPAENIIPVVRTDALEQWGPELVEAVDAVSVRLSTGQLRRLNLRVAESGLGVDEVIRDWLTTTGIIETD